MRSVLLRWLLCLLGAAGCASTGSVGRIVWSYDPRQYFGDRDFIEGSFFSKDAVLVSKVHDSIAWDKPLVALDPSTGEVRWRLESAEWVLHPAASAHPLLVASRVAQAARPLNAHFVIRELDPATGREKRRTPVSGGISTYQTRLDYGPPVVPGGHDRIYWSGGGRLGAIDAVTGQRLWEVESEADYLRPLLALPDRLVTTGPRFEVRSTQDGSLRGVADGICCGAFATPDGRRVYVRTEVGRSAEIDAQGRTVRALEGEVVAVSNRWVALDSDSGTGPATVARLLVHEHGSPTPALVIECRGQNAYFRAVALRDDRLFYYRGTDDTLWLRRLPDGKERRVYQAYPRLVIAPDAVGMAPAFLTTPPVHDPPLLFVLDWIIHALALPPDD